MRECIGIVCAELRGYEIFHPGFFYNLRKRPGKAEAVGKPIGVGVNSEFSDKKLSAVKELPYKTLARGYIRIGLDPCVAHYLPLSGLYFFFDTAENIGRVFFDHIVKHGLALSKFILRIFVHELESVRKCPHCLSLALLYGPKPRNVYMRMAAHYNLSWVIIRQLAEMLV